MDKADIIDVCAYSIKTTIGDEWKHEVGIWGASGRHLNFACDNKEYVLVLTEVADGHHWSEYLSSAADVREVRHGYKRAKETREEREGEAYLAGFRRGRAVVSGNEIIDFVLNYGKEEDT